MKKLISAFVLLVALQVSSYSQTTATWMGGTPGKTTDWNCPTNWKEGRIPDDYTQVLIPSDLLYYPVIKSNVPDIDALMVTGGATLTIDPNASLTILGETGRYNGLIVLGRIQNNGSLQVESMNQIMPEMVASVQGAGHFKCSLSPASDAKRIEMEQ